MNHAGTSRLYTDLGLLTCDPQITHDVVELFHYLTGRSLKRDYKKLLVAPGQRGSVGVKRSLAGDGQLCPASRARACER